MKSKRLNSAFRLKSGIPEYMDFKQSGIWAFWREDPKISNRKFRRAYDIINITNTPNKQQKPVVK